LVDSKMASNPNFLHKTPTGIEGLDEITNGGIPTGRPGSCRRVEEDDGSLSGRRPGASMRPWRAFASRSRKESRRL
jgi:hypothetical protein